MSIPEAILTSTLVNFSITKARLTSRPRAHAFPRHFMPGFPRHIKYSRGNTDIYACEPQYYRGKPYINAADPYFP